MPPAARIGDMHTCPMVTGTVPHVGGPILPPCEPTVLIGMMPAARVGDMAVCTGPPDSIVKGSMSVLIGNKPAARIGDTTAHGGVIVAGCPTVLIGDMGGGPGGGGGGAGTAASTAPAITLAGALAQILALIAAKQAATPFCEVCAGVAPTALAKTTAPAQSKPPPPSASKVATCDLNSLQIKCGHGERGFLLEVGKNDRTGRPMDLLEVVAGPDGDLIQVVTSMGKPYCPNHLKKSVEISPATAYPQTTPLSATASFKAQSPPEIAALINTSPFALLWIPAIPRRSYSVRAASCGRTKSAKVVVYPALKWHVVINAFTFTSSRAVSGKSSSKAGTHTKTKERSHSVEVSLEYGRQKRELGVEFSRQLESTLSAGQRITGMLNRALEWGAKFGDIEVGLIWPSLSIEGEWEHVECKGHWAVGLQGKISLSLDPLFGLEGTWNILNTVLKLIPGLGVVITPVKKAVEKASGQELGIFLKATGKIGGAIEASRSINDNQWRPGGEVTGSIEIQLYAGIEPKGEDKWVEFTVGGKSGITGTGKAAVDNRGYGLKDMSIDRDEVVAFVHAAVNLCWGIKTKHDRNWTLFKKETWLSHSEPCYFFESNKGA